MRLRAIAFLFIGAAVLPAQVRLPEYTREVLPNGVTLDLMPKHDVPLVTLQAVVRGGSEADPANLSGLTALTAELLRKGAASRTGDQFSQELDYMGATFNTRTDEQASVISMEFLSKDAARAVPLFADALVHPAFPQAEVTKKITQTIDEVKVIKDEPQFAARLYFRSFFFGTQHPYGHPVRGDEQTLGRIDRAKLVEQHKRLYTGKNLILIAAGDFDPKVFGQQLRQAFTTLPAGGSYGWRTVPDVTRSSKPRLLMVDKPDSTQTYFYIGEPGISRKNPDRIPLLLVNTLFGGRFTSLLNDELRVNSGLTYGAGSTVEERRLPGSLYISTYTKTETTGKAIDLALDILSRFQQRGITAEQLASAKAYVKGIFPTQRLETADQLANVLTDLELYDLSRDEIDQFFARIDAVTLEQANAAAAKYYRPDNLTFVLLGNAKAIAKEVQKYAPAVVSLPVSNPGFGVPTSAVP